MNEKIPTTIFTGFLGSGKTTVITNLVDELQKNNIQVVYIKNEIGDADVDTKILEGKGIKSKELLNGCICCTLVGPFANAIDEVIEQFQPDRIIIEASGAADPSALALTISAHNSLKRDGVVAVVDVLNFIGYKDLSITTQAQTKFTDLIVFNKVELATLQQKKVVVGYVRELNGHSPIVEAPKGRVSPEVIFGLDDKDLDQLLRDKQDHHAENDHKNHPEDHNHQNHDHISKDGIQTFNLKLNGVYSRIELEEVLGSLPKNIFRTKGLVWLKNNSENSQLHIFNTVGNRVSFDLVSTDQINQENLFVFIGYQAHQHESEIKEKLVVLLDS
jgi:G3E family GTPase